MVAHQPVPANHKEAPVVTVSGSVLLLASFLVGALVLTTSEPVWARSDGPGTASFVRADVPTSNQPMKGFIIMAENTRSSTGAAEMAAAKTLTTKVLAIGSWTAKAVPETRPAIMPSEARDTLRLMLAGKIDQWFAKSDGSGAVFLMNVTDPAEAHKLLEDLPLGRADMMTFELIPVGPLWPLGLMLAEPAK
jgi:hypothetical protein